MLRVRLAEIVSALSLATDLGLGLPQEHVLRQCRISMGVAEQLGLSDEVRAATYYVTLLAWVGCTADSHELSQLFGDDIALRADSYDIDMKGLPMLGFMLRRVGSGRPPAARARMAAALVATSGRAAAEAMTAHCQSAAAMADQMGLGKEVSQPLTHVFARWDGGGIPAGVAGEALPMPIRLVQLADVVEVYHRRDGPEAAVRVARERSGGQFDPRVVEAFSDCAGEVLGALSDGAHWDAVIAAEPGLTRTLTEPEFERVLEAMADFADLKSPWLTGHSRAVAALAEAAAADAGLPAGEVADLRRAALLHDLGRTGIPNSIWDKPGTPSESEHERVRLYPYYTQRILARPQVLARIGDLAASAQERSDGSGYHRGLPGAALTPSARILAAADVWRAMSEPRPHRPALEPEQAAVQLREEVRAGRLDGAAVESVLSAAGMRASSDRAGARPAGLTPRELEVLVLLARGASSRDIARELVIAEKTARNHTERVYTKLGVTSRAAAALYAMRHGIVD